MNAPQTNGPPRNEPRTASGDTEFRMPPVTRVGKNFGSGGDPAGAERSGGGRLRRVGFEFEFADLSLEQAAEAVQELFGGERVEEDRFHLRVEGTDLGDFGLEVDASLLRDQRYLEELRRLGLPVDGEDLQKPIEKLVGWLAELVVPFEVTTPPIPLDALGRMEELRVALARRRAQGTGARLHYAMGLHINPEAPALDADSVLRHLRAFLALYDWLLHSSDIDVARSLAPFIDPFPKEYAQRVLDPDYDPSFEDLARHYVESNPTRNRPLDLLPLFAHVLGREALESFGGLGSDELVKSRPTYHYRLPNCRIDEPAWRVAAEWNRWVEVERLAARPEDLTRFCAAALSGSGKGLWDEIKERARDLLDLQGGRDRGDVHR